jgi:membrane protease YdiL (CAAX protease family)
MIGIAIALAISWILLYALERKSIHALGLVPWPKRLLEFGIGILVTGLLCCGVQFLRHTLRSSEWSLNTEFSRALLFDRFLWDLKSVVTEELIFRGALLYVLIHRLGVSKGTLISAIAFGVYHWFSFGIIGNSSAMIVVFIGTGLMGYAWAWAFAKTGSIAMPIGLHLGWNFTFNTIFSNGPLGNGLLLTKSDITVPEWFSLVGLWGVPLIVLLFVKYFVKWEAEKI